MSFTRWIVSKFISKFVPVIFLMVVIIIVLFVLGRAIALKFLDKWSESSLVLEAEFLSSEIDRVGAEEIPITLSVKLSKVRKLFGLKVDSAEMDCTVKTRVKIYSNDLDVIIDEIEIEDVDEGLFTKIDPETMTKFFKLLKNRIENEILKRILEN